MLPMSSLGMPGAVPGMQVAAQPQQAGGLVSFASTGIPGLNGGYAYPPGSEMASFLDNLNGTVASASHAPDGSSIIAWANGLAQQAAIRQQQQAQLQAQQAQAAAAQAASAGDSLMQMLQDLLNMLMSKVAAKNGTAQNAPQQPA